MSDPTQRIGILTAFYEPAYKGGGPIRTLEALVRHMPQHFEPVVLTSDRDLHEQERLPIKSNSWVHRGRAQVYYASTDSLLAFARGLLALRRSSPSILYINSFFDTKFSIIPLILVRLRWIKGADILLAPRGEFSPGALQLKSLKKLAFIRLSKILRLHRNISWHASTALEVQDIYAIFPEARRIVEKNNETLLEPRDSSSAAGSAHKDGPLRAVFASRLVPIKGLHILLESLKTVSEDVTLDLIGGEEDAHYVAKCREIVESLPGNIRINFLGPLPHDSLLVAIADYDVMLFPTLGENFGHVVAEALSVGLPVFCSNNTPWGPVLSSGGGGVVTPNTPAAWNRQISQLAVSSPTEVLALKNNAREAFRLWIKGRNSGSVFDLLYS